MSEIAPPTPSKVTINNERLAAKLTNVSRKEEEITREEEERLSQLRLQKADMGKKQLVIKIGQTIIACGVMYLLNRFDVQGKIIAILWAGISKLKFW